MDLLEIMEEAIKREVAANRLYLEAASKATGEELKRLFLRLAAEEEKHKQILVAEYEKAAGRAVSEEWLL
jgi:rubrerythrin